VDRIENECILVTKGPARKFRDRVAAAGGRVLFEYHHIFQGLAIRGLEETVVTQMMGKTDEDILYSTPVRCSDGNTFLPFLLMNRFGGTESKGVEYRNATKPSLGT